VPRTREELTEFLEFHDRVYAYRSAAHREFLPLSLPILLGESPFAVGRELRPFLASDGSGPLARVVACIDRRYQDLWGESLGHCLLFEAMPRGREAARQVLEAACEWLRERGATAARAGMGMLEFPFAIDDYESLPPLGVRQNPPWYHAFLKDAGFETEKGLVDYAIEVTPERIARYEQAVTEARRQGYELVPLAELPEARRRLHFVSVYNETFRRHWGYSPFTEEDMALLLELQRPLGALATSLVAYRDGQPAGVLWVAPEATAFARVDPGRRLRPEEKLNFLGIGVREPFRGTGLAVAMAAFSYLELIRRGARWLGYTMVLDDNWPSRRTAEKLGARVRANYVVYRRSFGRRTAG
jgi:GNAT superfamily N-acetyltransferase